MVNVDAVEILLVEDNPNDVELTLRALKKHNLANNVMVVRNGAEALDFNQLNDALPEGIDLPKRVQRET